MGTPRLIYLKKSMISYGDWLLGAHRPNEIINELMGILKLFYLKKPSMSYASGVLGFPGLIYLKKLWISY